MRLISLYIRDYKNIKNQTFDFSNGTGYIALIGLNGSGKSNLLEAISLIFNGLLNNKKIPFDYELQYEYEGKTYMRKPRIASIDGARVKDSDMIYPSSVIACYSGEDLRLWHESFEDYYMHYFNQAIKNSSFSPQLIYVNKYCWKIAFIALFCSEKAETKNFFKDCLQIKDLTSINCRFTIDEKKRNKFKEHNALKWFNRIEALQKEDADNLINANTIRTIDMSMYGITNLRKKSQYIFQYLYLLSLPERNPDKGQMVDKLIEEIKIYIDGIDFDALSEGEKKMILIECITQILGDESSLILLDEPDAHVHVEYKKKMLEAILSFNGQTVFTTHSPVICNLIPDPNNIKLLKDGIWIDTSKLEQLKKLSGNEMQYFDGAFILSSKNILVTEGTYDSLYLNQAISFFEKEDVKYSKLRDITMVYSGGTGNALTFYEQILKTTSDIHDKIVYLFDYDKAGLTGWKAIDAIGDPKVIPIFYQEDYSVALDTEIPSNNIAPKDTILVEDLFDSHSYESKVIVVHNMNTHREFRCNTQGKTTDAIKSYIEKSYLSFKKEWFGGFKPVLDKLLDVFDLN